MKKVVKKIVAILCLILIFFNGGASTVSAATYTAEEASQIVANFSINYYNSMSSQVHYYVDDWASSNSERAKAYLKQSNACSHKYTYGMDCVGFVSIAIHESLGIGSDTSFTVFVSPQSLAKDSHYTYINGSYEEIKNNLIPGDILICSTSKGSESDHVMVYVGNGKIVHCASGLQYQAVTQSKYYSRITGYARLVNASDINSTTSQYIATTTGSSSSITGGGDLSDFYFNGIPDGNYSVGTVNVIDYLLTALKNVADYLVGILTYAIRIVVVGWTAAIHQWITNAANAFFTGDDTSSTDGISSVEIDSADYTLTIEKLVYNTYKALDVNIFNND